MRSPTSLVATVACAQLTVALVMAWTLVSMNDFKIAFVLRAVKNHRDFVRAHLDYLLMSLFLFVFFLIYRTLNFECTWMTALLVSWGSTVNPLGFLIPSFFPSADHQPRYHPYKLLLYSGFVATTTGFLSVIVDILRVVS